MFKNLVARRMQYPWEKKNSAGPKQVALENNVNFPWKFLGSKKVPYMKQMKYLEK
jgi:hypothetical protein